MKILLMLLAFGVMSAKAQAWQKPVTKFNVGFSCSAGSLDTPELTGLKVYVGSHERYEVPSDIFMVREGQFFYSGEGTENGVNIGSLVSTPHCRGNKVVLTDYYAELTSTANVWSCKQRDTDHKFVRQDDMKLELLSPHGPALGLDWSATRDYRSLKACQTQDS